jgi:hypothetical protein
MARRVWPVLSVRKVKTESGATPVRVVDAVWRAMTALIAGADSRR